jgi:chromosomal replication initiator protein
MGKAAAAACARTPAEGVQHAVRERIGAERFGVWFGEAAWSVTLADGRPEVIIRAGSGVTHEWLRRTFRTDVEAAARAVCGRETLVRWEPAVESPAVPAQPAAPAAAPGRRKPRAAAIAVRPAAGLAVFAAEPATPPAARGPARGRAEFVAGPSNRMALAVVEIAAARPGELSPLVIHGPSGVGKTHLLETACGRARELHPGIQAVFLSAEQFTTAFLQALHGGGLPGFRRTCRSAELLVIDDLQFFAGKKATLQELQQTIDALCRQGRQIVLGSDRELDALGDLGSDLLTRLRGGMTARIMPPDYEVRRGIVAAIASSRGLALPDDVVHHVATSMTRHARELFGAVNRLEATSHMLGLPITLELAREALADLVRSSGRSMRLADIDRAVCVAFGIEPGMLQSARRSRAVSHPRMLAMYLSRRHTRAALAEIGGYFGRRSHSTVVAAHKAVTGWITTKTPIVLAEAAWDVEEAIRRVEDILRGM